MRLVCPNCGAQYEVDDRVIPDSGRDVQCSSCGHAWYQMPASMDAAEEPVIAEPEEGLGADDDATDFEPESEPVPEPEPAPVEKSADDADAAGADVSEPPVRDAEGDEPEAFEAATEAATEATDDAAESADTADDDDAAPATGADGAALPRRELDQNLRSILQEEVAREMAARAEDGGAGSADLPPDPTATDAFATGPSEPDPTLEPSKALDVDALAGIGSAPADAQDGAAFAAAAAALADGDKAPRKDLFPDIEEINSTLDSHGPVEDPEEQAAPDGRGGFGRAFFTIIFIAALALALYLVAPKLAQSIPALEPALSGYVDAVNGARGWLDSTLQGLTNRIDSAE